MRTVAGWLLLGAVLAAGSEARGQTAYGQDKPGFGQASQYSQAAAAYRQAASRETGANRACYLANASYYDCLAQSLNTTSRGAQCTRPTCAIAAAPQQPATAPQGRATNIPGAFPDLGTALNNLVGTLGQIESDRRRWEYEREAEYERQRQHERLEEERERQRELAHQQRQFGEAQRRASADEARAQDGINERLRERAALRANPEKETQIASQPAPALDRERPDPARFVAPPIMPPGVSSEAELFEEMLRQARTDSLWTPPRDILGVAIQSVKDRVKTAWDELDPATQGNILTLSDYAHEHLLPQNLKDIESMDKKPMQLAKDIKTATGDDPGAAIETGARLVAELGPTTTEKQDIKTLGKLGGGAVDQLLRVYDEQDGTSRTPTSREEFLQKMGDLDALTVGKVLPQPLRRAAAFVDDAMQTSRSWRETGEAAYGLVTRGLKTADNTMKPVYRRFNALVEHVFGPSHFFSNNLD
jgi:hypothetical protein